MTVLAASVVTRSGRPLISRQFHGSFAKARLESLLVSFTKLIPANAEHTTVLSSDGSIRYVYAPVDELYVLLLTPPWSNIIQDLDTLRLLTRIVSETCASALGMRAGGGANQPGVLANSFELLSSFDEVISLGYRDKVGIGEVRAAMEMESHEERIQEIIARNKEMEAKEELKRRAKQLELQRKDMMRRGQDPYASLGNGTGLSRYDSYTPPVPPPVSSSSSAAYDPDLSASASSRTAPAAPKFKSKGMQLGSKANKNRDLVDALGGADEEPPVSAFQQPVPAAAPSPVVETAAAPAAPAAPSPLPSLSQVNPFGLVERQDVHCSIRETLSMELGREGGLSGPVSVTGSLDLHLGSADVNKVAIQLSHSAAAAADTQFKPHPNVDKTAWSKSSLVKMRDANKGFPVGQDVKVLRWKMSKKDDSLIPLAVNCWPSPSDQGQTVTVEYELENEALGTLKDVLISIPLPPGAYPTVDSCAGTCDVNPETHTLDWSLPEIDPADDEARSGLLEFSIPSDDSAAFYPIAVDMCSVKSHVDVDVTAAMLPANEDQAVDFSVDRLCRAEDYLIA